MANGQPQRVELLSVGDLVWGVGEGPVRLVDIEKPLLGDRKVIGFADGTLLWSEEHGFWVRDPVDARQWWWSFNPGRWRSEVTAGLIGGLKDNHSIKSSHDVEFAHISGFKKQKLHEHYLNPMTQLYGPMTHGAPIVINGYVVGAGINEYRFDYRSVDWEKERQNLQALKEKIYE